jgi:resuscitation-promoting factor RpfA
MSQTVPLAARTRPAPVGALIVAATAALASAAALGMRLLALALDGRAGLGSIDQVVELGVLAVGLAVAGWLALALVAAVGCATARLVGWHWAAGERFVARHAPVVVRRALALSIGAGVGLVAAVVPAVADQAAPPADLGWAATQVVAVPARATTPVPAPAPVPAAATAPPAPPPASAPTSGLVTVAPGDSLWRIAADHLVVGATDAQIAAAWPRWYDANRDVIGDDPHRIRPGQVLSPPAPRVADATGGAS